MWQNKAHNPTTQPPRIMYLLTLPEGRRFYVDSLLMAKERAAQHGYDLWIEEARHAIFTEEKSEYRFGKCSLKQTDRVSDALTVHDVEMMERIDRIESDQRERWYGLKAQIEELHGAIRNINYSLNELIDQCDQLHTDYTDMKKRVEELEKGAA